MKKAEPLGIYVHIPFCIRKCRYCDFVSHENTSRSEQLAYVERLCGEIRENGRQLSSLYRVDTVFFGGGTPSLLEAGELIRIFDCIGESFVTGCSDEPRGVGEGAPEAFSGLEISLEANPCTVNEEKLAKLKAGGFNRISIGVQSFNDAVLKALGRLHDAEQAEDAVRLAGKLGFNTNIDLIFGAPEMSLDIWESDINKALSLEPEHISFYSLQLEEGTPLYKDYRYGELELPSWEENRAMYHSACELLTRAGYIHYEISNAAKPGCICRHNMKYWSMQDYLGIGEAAHSYIAGRRTGEGLSDPKSDYIFTRLRLIEGFPSAEYESRFGIAFSEEFGSVMDSELIREEGGFVRLTKKGLDYTNPVIKSLLDAIAR